MANPTPNVTPELGVVDVQRPRDYKVKLIRAASLASGSRNVELVVWDASPEFTESRSVMYKNIDPVHAPGAIYQFGNTGARTFTINGKFISRSINEATRTLAYLQYLRTWAMPVFGEIGDDPAYGENILGAPPSILLLSAYATKHPEGSTSTLVPNSPGSKQFSAKAKQVAIGNNILDVPVVITNLDIPYPTDVDYIPTINNIPVPTIATVSITLMEAHSPNRYSTFNLQDFKAGNLQDF